MTMHSASREFVVLVGKYQYALVIYASTYICKECTIAVVKDDILVYAEVYVDSECPSHSCAEVCG